MLDKLVIGISATTSLLFVGLWRKAKFDLEVEREANKRTTSRNDRWLKKLVATLTEEQWNELSPFFKEEIDFIELELNFYNK